jgi:hypothetical protein
MFKASIYATCLIPLAALAAPAATVEYKLLINGVDAPDHVLVPGASYSLSVQARVTDNLLTQNIDGGLFQSAFHLGALPDVLNFTKTTAYSYAPLGAWAGQFNADFNMAMPGMLDGKGYSVFEHTAAVTPDRYVEKVSMGANIFTTVFEGSFQYNGGATDLALRGSIDSHAVAGLRNNELRSVFPDAVLGANLRIASDQSCFDNWTTSLVLPPASTLPIPDPIVIAPVPTVPEVPPSITPPVIELPTAPELPPLPDPPAIDPPAIDPPAIDPSATPAEPEDPVAPSESPIYVIRPGFEVDPTYVHETYVHEITPISIGWNHHWRFSGDLLNPTLIDLTTFDGGLRITDLSPRLFTGHVLFSTGIESSITLHGMDHDGALLTHAASSSQIPEPATAALTAFALLALAAARRR